MNAFEYQRCAKRLLEVKAKVFRGDPWGTDDVETIHEYFQKEGWPKVLAACCLFHSDGADKERAFAVMTEALQPGKVPEYIEWSLYESLMFADAAMLLEIREELLFFIRHSFESARDGYPINARVILRKMSEAGDSDAALLCEQVSRKIPS